MLLYDLSHTSHSRARTGVQRVALELRRALANETEGLLEITHDPFAGYWRPLRNWELKALDAPPEAAQRRGAYWSLKHQIKGYLEKALRQPKTANTLPAQPVGYFTPDIFTTRTGRNLPELFDHLQCPKVALFHDAISLRLPHLTPSSAVSRFPSYMSELHKFDGVMTISEDSRQSLLGYWEWAGWSNNPEVKVLPLGLDHLPTAKLRLQGNPPPAQTEALAPPTILSVGSLEGRKNHRSLIEACELLWIEGIDFNLQIIGTLQRDTGQAALDRLQELKQTGRPIQYDGWLDDDALESAFKKSAFTVYPSLLEGFGLPVWESLLHGKPCICSSIGATGETAQGGGCKTTDTGNPAALAGTIKSLLADPGELAALAAEAAGRTPPRWADCARQLLDWMPHISCGSEG